MRPEEIRELALVDIDQKIREISDELFDQRMRSAYEALENPRRIRALKRDIARLKTIKRERELKTAPGSGEK